MAILAGGILILFGLGWTGFAVVALLMGWFFTPDVTLPWYLYVLFIGPGLASLVAGVILLILGLAARKKKIAAANEVIDHGVPAHARVTFVDKNYAVTINEKPIYSIVEFEFTDSFGRVFTGRKENVDSDLVIRAQVAVGSEVEIKYLPSNPQENILLLYDPREVKK